ETSPAKLKRGTIVDGDRTAGGPKAGVGPDAHGSATHLQTAKKVVVARKDDLAVPVHLKLAIATCARSRPVLVGDVAGDSDCLSGRRCESEVVVPRQKNAAPERRAAARA